jgi:hypothetical protein
MQLRSSRTHVLEVIPMKDKAYLAKPAKHFC